MPLIRLRAMDSKKICTISKELVDELEGLLRCPRDYFTLEVINSTFIEDGEFVPGNAVVEVAWFDRGQQTQDEAAKIITRHIQSIGYTSVDVIFLALDEKRYYENGQHF